MSASLKDATWNQWDRSTVPQCRLRKIALKAQSSDFRLSGCGNSWILRQQTDHSLQKNISEGKLPSASLLLVEAPAQGQADTARTWLQHRRCALVTAAGARGRAGRGWEPPHSEPAPCCCTWVPEPTGSPHVTVHAVWNQEALWGEKIIITKTRSVSFAHMVTCHSWSYSPYSLLLTPVPAASTAAGPVQQEKW